MEIPLKTRNKIAYDPAIPPGGIYPEETKIKKDTCIPLFIEALLTIAGILKQTRCPLADKWIKKLWCIYIYIYIYMYIYTYIQWNITQP